MKQVLQDLSGGKTLLVDGPSPVVTRGAMLINSRTSLISAGTERMLVGFGKASLLGKVRQQPDKLKQVIEKVETDGLVATLDAVQSKLAQPLPLGYCNVGIVSKVGEKCEGFKVGDRVVSNGPHAETVNVPRLLAAKIPEAVDDESASFAVVASIGLQGVRLAEPSLGECFVVSGAGLIGLLTIQLLKAHGCRVLAIDFDDSKLALARQFGAETCNLARGEDAISSGMGLSRGRGVDGVIITASTNSNDPVSQAAKMCRKRGRIVLVGVTGLELNRADFYEKELKFQVSCSYGPGRYDPSYEEKGQDYPLPFVRWTEQRNFEAVLDMLADGKLDVQPLISHRFAIEDAPLAYDTLIKDQACLGIVLQYTSDDDCRAMRRVELKKELGFERARPVVGVIGAGNYSSRILIPAFKAAGAQLHTLVTAGGVNSVVHGKRAGFSVASTDADEIFMDPEINTIAVATRHDSHADYVVQALDAGKHVFVEKPIAIRLQDLELIKTAYKAAHSAGKNPQVMVGFNRRFAPHVQKLKNLLEPVREPKSFVMTVNAGEIPADHWTHDIKIGGGRIVGEACHFIDLMRYLANSEIVAAQARCMGSSSHMSVFEDKAIITLSFADGSIGSILYLANGASSFPKERIEVFAAGGVLQLDNFRRLKGFGWSGFQKMNLWRQDKGQNACAAAFLKAVEVGKPAIPIDEIFEVARVSIEVGEQLRFQ